MSQPTSAFLQNVNTESSKATYSAVISDFVPVANATDFFTISGSSSKIITITALRVNGAATASSFANIYVYKRTAANTGGTSSVITSCIHDSSDPAATAVVRSYSANPSALGTGALLRSEHVSFSAAAAGNLVTYWNFVDRGSKSVKLNNTNEFLCFNFGGNAVPSGANIHATIEWTEE
jgi:hypothetical protein